MQEQRGRITVFTGPMFSGKSTSLMAYLEKKERAHKKILVVKPDIDNRFDRMGEIIAKKKTSDRFSPCGSMPAYPIKDDLHLLSLFTEHKPDVLGVDEAQFFGDWLGVTLHLWRFTTHLEIFVAGLDLDAWQKPFGPMPELLAFADEVQKFTANCFRCGQEAQFTQKLGGSSDRIEVGTDIYEARCARCWHKPE
ncbi:thymidine kinase [Candidatus Parcubacteria bacterium]|nr:thymidine kinase [Candidatus Parcubacteria bacterium]